MPPRPDTQGAAEADGLAKLAAATRNINKENVVTLLHSSIDQVEVHSIYLSWEWRNRIVTYLQEGTLPQDKKEAKKLRIQAARYSLVNHDLYKRTFGGPLAKCLRPNQNAAGIRRSTRGALWCSYRKPCPRRMPHTCGILLTHHEKRSRRLRQKM
ncbi:PREDICTED: uncharacterized protein LOC109218401 [Nicotiana attenuata]|uniref:uncharacterized protein LOC109218401 n=1 Tax=Nicotiana attenuata TaxID=49451 RepID=UPI0009055688|nr:PREDICTED: uncharacterized protein LOC109218401 [Nicotiana attenuata]